MARRRKWRDFNLPLVEVTEGRSARIQEIGGKRVFVYIGLHGSIVVRSPEIGSFLVSLQTPTGKVEYDSTTHHGLLAIQAHRARRAQDRGATSFEFLEIPQAEQ